MFEGSQQVFFFTLKRAVRSSTRGLKFNFAAGPQQNSYATFIEISVSVFSKQQENMSWIFLVFKLLDNAFSTMIINLNIEQWYSIWKQFNLTAKISTYISITFNSIKKHGNLTKTSAFKLVLLGLMDSLIFNKIWNWKIILKNKVKGNNCSDFLNLGTLQIWYTVLKSF